MYAIQENKKIIAIYAIKCMLQFRHSINLFHDAGNRYFGSALFTDNLTISARLKFNMHVLITCHPIQITCATLVPWSIHNAAQEPDTQQLMRKLNFSHPNRLYFANIFSAWNTGSKQILIFLFLLQSTALLSLLVS